MAKHPNAKHPNDDLFAETTMSFGEHLEELRVALFRGLVGLVIGCLIGLALANSVVRFIQKPLTNALREYFLSRAVDDLKEKHGDNVPVEMLNTIEHQKLAPDTMKIDPHEFLSAIQDVYPEQFGDIEIKRFRFSMSDLVDKHGAPTIAAFAKRIYEEKDETDSPAAQIWGAMTAEQRRLIADVAQQVGGELQDEPKNAFAPNLPHQEQRGVLAALNAVIEKPLYRSATFAGAPGANADTEKTINGILEEADGQETNSQETATLNEEQTRRINRLLIASAFPDVIRPPGAAVANIRVWRPADFRLQALNAQEAFMIWLKAAFVTGMVLASPWIFYHIWDFVAAGLYPHEKRYVHIYLPFSLVLFLAGASMAFFFVFEPVLDFLFSFNKAMDIDPDPRIGEWLSFVLFLPLGFGIAFQLPLVMLFINRLGIVNVNTYVQKWRIAILVIFVISMLLTPADPISMLLMACPLTVLYFLGVALCFWMPRGRNPFAEAYEP